jgi:ATP-dependent DNA helicase RecG
MKPVDVQRLAAAGESEDVEFKKSTSQLQRAAETLCGFLNGDGGSVLIGVTPEGQVVGQSVADSTLQAVAALLGRFEPAAPVRIHRVRRGKSGDVLVLEAPPAYDARPFAFDGRA